MVTTKDFKATHSISDSAFQRLVKKICDASQVTRQDLICPINSTEHEIIKLDLFEEAIKNRKPRTAASKKSSGVIATEEIAISPTQVMPASQVNAYGGFALATTNQGFDTQTALAEFHSPAPTAYVEVSTALQVKLSQESMVATAIAAQQYQSNTFEAMKRQAVEQGVRDGQELARLRHEATIQSLNGGTGFLAQTQGLALGVQES